MTDPHKVLDDILRESVIIITDSDLGPRPGQRDLAHDVLTAMEGRGRVSGIGPTGLGKSVALLAPAMTMAAVAEERTLISTESLSLQHQYLDKDAPTIAEATERVTGHLPTFSVHKGFSNHVCRLAAHSAAKDLTGADLPDPEVATYASDSARRFAALQATRDAHEAVMAHKVGASRKKAKVGDHLIEPKPFVELLRWATDPDGDGDKARYTGEMPKGGWAALSVTPQECPGATGCPFAAACLPLAARARSAAADIVVTNHALLGIQAATAAPVVLGNRKLGNFSHLMVDEAHSLPGIVRNGGSVELGARRVGAAVAALNSVVDAGGDRRARALVDMGNDATDGLENALSRTRGLTSSTPAVYDPDTMESLADALSDVGAWAGAAASFIPEAHNDLSAFIRLRRTKSRLESLADDVSTCTGTDTGIPMARWVEESNFGRAFKASPVDVSPHIAGNLFTAKLVPDATLSEDEVIDEATGAPIKVAVSVTMVSATLPSSFRADSGIGVPTREYPSPFDSAYGDSMAYCPKPTEDDLPRLAVRGANGRWKFDPNLHAEWATERIIELVEANNGSALVLSANTRNGERYAAALRERFMGTGIEVHSQWDGRDPRLILDQWRAEESSVMVGTKSMMTGVDAKGETCSLVIIDRAPRAMGNVVDDARVEAIMAALDLDKWSADRFVYVSDAALLLEQAFGRLIRSMSDSGLAVCLDPRIVPGSPLSYNRAVSDSYLRAMRRFTNRRSSMASAKEFLEGRRLDG